MYIGSVRFFKHLFMTIYLLLIVVPTIVAICLGISNYNQRKELANLKLEINSLKVDIANQSKNNISTVPGELISLPPSKPDSPELHYQALYPDLYTDPPAQLNRAKKTSYLTFDALSPKKTEQVLDTLKEKGVKATFFLVGAQLPGNEPLIRRMYDEGHAIGIHSYNYDYAHFYDSIENYLSDFETTRNLIYDITGEKVDIFRFAGGSINAYNTHNYRELIGEMTRRGFTFYDWNVSACDNGSKATLDSVYEEVVSTARKFDRSIVLMGDETSEKHVEQLLPLVIDELQKQGYTLDKLTNKVATIFFSYMNK